MVGQNHKVDEITDARVLAVAEVTQHRMEFLRGMAIDIDDLKLSNWDSGEVERVRQGDFSVMSSSYARGDMSSRMRPKGLSAI
ncbi:hypothetical protein BMG05_17340 [Mycobacterium malmoense]|nr:hypothetical protein BMG05_17340 [Mycobacterium malmoense]